MAIRDKGKTLPKVDPSEVAKALGAEPAPPKVLKIRMSKQVKMFLQTLPPDDQKALIDQFAKLASGDMTGVEMTPEERATFESEGLVLERAEFDEEDETEN